MVDDTISLPQWFVNEVDAAVAAALLPFHAIYNVVQYTTSCSNAETYRLLRFCCRGLDAAGSGSRFSSGSIDASAAYLLVSPCNDNSRSDDFPMLVLIWVCHDRPHGVLQQLDHWKRSLRPKSGNG